MCTKQELLDKISEESLMTFTKQITKEVRLSSSLAERRSFEYAERLLSELGYQTNLYYRKAFISLPDKSELTVNGVWFNSITHSMAASTEEEGMVAELQYIGEERYEEISEVKKRAVLIDGLATPTAVKKAEEKGAVAAIFINAEYTHEMIVSTVWGNPDLDDIDKYPKIPVASVNYKDGQEIIKMLNEANGPVNIKLKTKVFTQWREIPTLIADYKFNDKTDNFLLFSGHIDSWHFGVMDNGTANAVMLECARILKEAKSVFHRNLRIAFWSGHSHGRYAGSALYADENFEELYDHCLLHLNIDSVGAKNSTVLTEGNTMKETKELIANSVKFISGQQFEGTRFGRAGDQSFWGMGIPSALMGLSEQPPNNTPAMRAFSKLFGGGKGGGFGWWWHTTEDTIDKIDPSLLKRDCEIYLSIIYDFCTSNILPIKQSAAIEEIERALLEYESKHNFGNLLEVTHSRLRKLKEFCYAIEEHIESNKCNYQNEINDWIKKMSRGLVQINYVDQNEFDHDEALAQPPIPSIGNALIKGSLLRVDSNVIQTTLKRRINKINFKLRELLFCTEKLAATIRGDNSE